MCGNKIPNLVRALQDRETCKQAVSKMKWGRFNKRIVNDLRVTDHHGLLIRQNPVSTERKGKCHL